MNYDELLATFPSHCAFVCRENGTNRFSHANLSTELAFNGHTYAESKEQMKVQNEKISGYTFREETLTDDMWAVCDELWRSKRALADYREEAETYEKYFSQIKGVLEELNDWIGGK